METSRHSVHFFRAVLEGVQRACREHIAYRDHIEVSGYLAVEIDDVRKERYIISELMHAAGSIMSESYCTKVFNTKPVLRVMHQTPGTPPSESQHPHPASPSQSSVDPGVGMKFELQEVSDNEVEFKLESCDVTREILADPEPREDRSTGGTLKELAASSAGTSSSACPSDKHFFTKSTTSFTGRAAELDHLQALHDSIVKDAGRNKQSCSYSARQKDSMGNKLTKAPPHSGAVSAQPTGSDQVFRSGSLDHAEDDVVQLEPDVLKGVRSLHEAVPVGQPWSVSKGRPEGSVGKRVIDMELQPSPSKRGKSSDRGGQAIVSPSSAADDSGMNPLSGAGDKTETSFISNGFNEDDSNDCIIVPEWPEERQQQHGNRLQPTSLAQAGFSQNYASLVRLSNNALVDFDPLALGTRSAVTLGQTLASKHTLRKTRGHMQQFQRFLSQHGDARPMATIPPNELDPFLGAFFSRLRKDDGEEYDPGYVRNIQSSLERYLRFKGYAWSIVRDPEFAGSRAELKSKQERLFSQCRPDGGSAMTARDIDVFFERGQLGTSSPESILNSMWFMVNLYFGPKGVREHAIMVWGDIVLDRDESGTEFLRYTALSGSSDLSRTRIRVVANPANHNRCYVHIYKRYRDLRPPNTFHPSSPFYLGLNQFVEDAAGAGVYHFRATSLSTYRLVGIIRRMSIACNMADRKLSNVSFNSFVMQLHDKGLLQMATTEPSGVPTSADGQI